MKGAVLYDERRLWRCQKHPSRSLHGVCPKCLRDRLLLLCPDCAHVRPCGCFQSSSSAFSSFSSLSSFDPPRSSDGAVGRVGDLINDEHAFPRSRSAAFRFLRPRTEEERHVGKNWPSLWPFSKAAPRREEETSAPEKLLRARSVVAASSWKAGGGDGENGRNRGWHWLFPNPMNAFRHRKLAKVVQERSPFRGR